MISMILFFLGFAFAQDSHLTYFESHDRLQIAVGLQTSTIATTRGSLVGLGPLIEFDFGLSRKFSAGLIFSQVLDTSERAALFLDMYGYFKYSLTGSALGSRRRVLHRGDVVIDETILREDGIGIGFGPEQLIVNGSVSAYPSSGFAVSAHWGGQVFSVPINTQVRASSLAAQGISLNLVSLLVAFRF